MGVVGFDRDGRLYDCQLDNLGIYSRGAAVLRSRRGRLRDMVFGCEWVQWVRASALLGPALWNAMRLREGAVAHATTLDHPTIPEARDRRGDTLIKLTLRRMSLQDLIKDKRTSLERGEHISIDLYNRLHRHLTHFKFWPTERSQSRKLWSHQVAAISLAAAYFSAGRRLPLEGIANEAALIKMATGTGKSAVITVCAVASRT